jgi:colanic acid/amylovoran biosynthesis glycosyltransferase
MLTIAYLANQFPSPVEPYVDDEIRELRGRGIRVIAGSVRNARRDQSGTCAADVVLQPLRLIILLRTAWLCVRRWRRLSGLVLRVIYHGREGPLLRMKALAHTWLGACYAVMLAEREIDHIHVHHGYFASWVAMVAARLLNVSYSMTLHGSDLLLHGAFLDVKLANCKFCLTVSEYNQRYILDHYSEVQSVKVVIARLGVEVPEHVSFSVTNLQRDAFTILAVGRLHGVKDHAFLVRACAQLAANGVRCECLIAGAGPERRALELQIRRLGLEKRVTLLGHVAHEQMGSLYDRADFVVLTSRSEGIPLVLMEAMARGKIVLASAITGIPELVVAGKSGFLYEAGSLDDFLAKLLLIRSLMQKENRADSRSRILLASRRLDWMRHAARVQVHRNFNRRKNLEFFGDLFVQRIDSQTERAVHENFVLQQIQPSVQWHRGIPIRVDGVDAVARP